MYIRIIINNVFINCCLMVNLGFVVFVVKDGKVVFIYVFGVKNRNVLSMLVIMNIMFGIGVFF